MNRRIAVLPAMVGLVLAAACGQGSSPGVTAANTSVEAAYTCPAGANDARYDVHVTTQLHNAGSSSASVRSVTAQLTLEATHGSWAEKIGDRYNAGAATFTPATVPAGGTATLQVTVVSACTNGKSGSAGQSYGEYRVTLDIATSAGTVKTTSTNLHRIVAA